MLKQSRFANTYPYFLGLSGLLFCSLFCFSWAPGFPVTAKMIAVPGLYIIRAPEDAVVEEIMVNKKDVLRPGQTVLGLRYLQTLSQNTSQDEDVKRLESRLLRLNSVLLRQEHLYQQYQLLADKKLISVVELLQKKDEMRRLLDEKAQLGSEIENLKFKMGISFKMPFQGQLDQSLVQVGQVVKAKQVLMVFRPLLQSYFLKVKIPLVYQKYITMKQLIKLNFIQNQKIKTYPISARVMAIYPRVITQEKRGPSHYFLLLRASIDKRSNLSGMEGINNVPLEGFLMGPRRPIYQWILDSIQGNI